MIRVTQVMTKHVITIDSEAKIIDACRLMGEKHIGSLIVTKNNRPAGIFTERDLLSKVLLAGIAMDKSKIGEYMSAPLTVISPDFDLREAARVMTQLRIRRLPVIDNEKLIGILTSADITKAIGESPLEI
jgi:CBS domain-containing protein